MTSSTDLATLSPSEKDALIRALLARVEALRLEVEGLRTENAALRDKLSLPLKTPRNSSKPPSQGPKASRETEAKPKGKPHPGAYRSLHPSPTQRREVRADCCPRCQADVTAVAQVPLHTYDWIEIPEITPDVTRVTLYGGTCPCCRGWFKAAAPGACPPGSPFGPNLRAFVLYLRFAQVIPFERLARLLSDLFGLEISEGALANILHDSAPAFATQANAIKRQLLSGSVLQSDETSARVGKRTFWTWVFHHADSACFVTAASRGKKVVEAFLGDLRPDVWVSDRFGAQMGWARTDHQVCLAHLIRDVQYVIDAGDTAFAPGVMGLLKRAVGIGRRRQTLADTTLVLYQSRLQKRLDTLLAIVPTTAAGQKLQRILKRFRQNLFVFVTNRAVPPTNNGSEQALRPCVVFRKVTNCFRAEWSAALYADVRSVFETARRRGIPILSAIRLTLGAKLLPDGT
ncbi:MAG: IS66 family transposase [Armatimonadota bacterium]|nr:IS66 family transposase [Armatimonadota bacterium]